MTPGNTFSCNELLEVKEEEEEERKYVLVSVQFSIFQCYQLSEEERERERERGGKERGGKERGGKERERYILNFTCAPLTAALYPPIVVVFTIIC